MTPTSEEYEAMETRAILWAMAVFSGLIAWSYVFYHLLRYYVIGG